MQMMPAPASVSDRGVTAQLAPSVLRGHGAGVLDQPGRELRPIHSCDPDHAQEERQLDLEVTLSGNAGAEEPALLAAEARAPRRVALGAGNGLAIRSVHREGADGHERVAVEVAAPKGTPVDLLVEGPTPEWALPPPEPTIPASASLSRTRRFTFSLDEFAARRTCRRRDVHLHRRFPRRRHRAHCPSD